MTVCEILGLHSLVPARQFDHSLEEWRHLYWSRGGSFDRIPARPDYRDGLACVRCPHFEAQPLTRSQAPRSSTHSPT